MQALFMNLAPPSSCSFFNSGPKKALSLTGWKNVISKPTKNDVFNYGIYLKKIIQQDPITSLPMFFNCWGIPNTIETDYFAGFNSPVRLRLCFCWVRRGCIYGFGLWEVKMLWVPVMGVTLVYILQASSIHLQFFSFVFPSIVCS
jgi:hypothetical protein